MTAVRRGRFAAVSPARRRLIAVGVGAVVVVMDLLTKQWALTALSDVRSVDVVGSLVRFELTFNPGAAFGSFQGAGPILGVVAVLATVWMVWYAGRVDSALAVVGLGLIVGGAIGNLVDRVTRGDGLLDGRVVDFIRLPNWPNFNVADMAVFFGVIFVVVHAFTGGAGEEPNAGDGAGGDTDGAAATTEAAGPAGDEAERQR